ncbi:MAG: arginase family protein [Chloroflexi bacterium]|nr:arginase family protein [Chloroflexota bacterium]
MNAREWLASGGRAPADVTLVGAPISRASISPSQAWSTPPALRDALARFPTWDAEHGQDLSTLRIHDAGDVEGDREDADARAAHERIEKAVRSLARSTIVVVIGGDNSLTRPAMRGAMAARPGAWGLLTLDAHHDCRPPDQGPRNGTPVRDLIEAGLPGECVAQLGIHPLGNAREHAEWARDHGVRVHPIDELRRSGMRSVLTMALDELLRQGVEHVYVDIDVDVVDRAFAPACPASLPGGLLPAQLLDAAHALGSHPHVAAMDITEVDASADVTSITVRLAAAALLSFCSGVAGRPRSQEDE